MSRKNKSANQRMQAHAKKQKAEIITTSEPEASTSPQEIKESSPAPQPADTSEKLLPGSPTPERSRYQRASGTQVIITHGFIAERERNNALTKHEKYRTYANMLVNCTTVSASVNWFLALIARAKWSVAACRDGHRRRSCDDVREDVVRRPADLMA